MRVVAKGEQSPVEIEIKCGGCSSVLAITKHDLIETFDRNETLRHVDCPECKVATWMNEDEFYFAFLQEGAGIPPIPTWQKLVEEGPSAFNTSELFTLFEVFAYCYAAGQRRIKVKPTVNGFKGWLRKMSKGPLTAPVV